MPVRKLGGAPAKSPSKTRLTTQIPPDHVPPREPQDVSPGLKEVYRIVAGLRSILKIESIARALQKMKSLLSRSTMETLVSVIVLPAKSSITTSAPTCDRCPLPVSAA